MDWRNLEPTVPAVIHKMIRQATVAFVFATLSSFKALLHDSASGLLEDWFHLVSDFQDVSGWGTPRGIHMWCDGWAMVLEAFGAFEACEGFDFLPKLRSLPCDWWISLVPQQRTCGSLCDSQLKQR